jgi:outer membrane protein OmpA-like peptidoglycan-associated protein
MKYILLLLFITSAGLYPQSGDGKRYNAFSGTIVFSVEGGAAIAATDYIGSKPDYMGRTMLEFFIPAYSKSSFGLRLFGNAGFMSEEETGRKPSVFRTSFSSAGAGVIYSLNFSDFFFPYLFAGAGYIWFNPMDENGSELPGNRDGDYSVREINYFGEFGMRFMLTRNLSFNLSAGLQISPNDYWDDSREGTSNDLMVQALAGFSFAFLTESDNDKDGVPDSRDLCPGTPLGMQVDASGCPKDSDKDGVADYLDKCPRTPSKVVVDENGCPVDTDLDGVPDYQDLCPKTPAGMRVDNSGCPDDSDNDGVADYQDKCPDTPYDVEVDESGCPKDDDLDGVPDYLDKCPKTPAGEKVDRDGCSVKGDVVRIDPGVKEVILSSGASFASGKTEILPGAFEDLNKLLYEMKEDPLSRWRIEGYTDNIGSDQTNKNLSLKRAEAVREFFVNRGISASRFEIFGFGKANPVASNDTEEGRAKNRRVRIIRTN